MEQNFKRTLTTVSCQKNLLVSGRANPDFSLESVRLVLTFSNIFNLLTVQSCFRCSDTGSDLDQTGGQIWLYSQRSLSRRHFFNLLLVKKGNFLSSVTKLLVADSLQTGIRTNVAMLNIKKKHPENNASLFEGATLGHGLCFWDLFVTCDSEKKLIFAENKVTELTLNWNVHGYGF